MKGLSVKNSTAFTSSSILAVVSAMKARSAECKGARILTGLELSEDPTRTEGVTMSSRILTICAAALAFAPLAADAQSAATFRCQGKDGKKYYGNTIPPQCYGRLVEQINAQGFVVKR